MAEEELDVEVDLKQKKKERPIRRITYREKDTSPALTDEIVEFTQQVLDELEVYSHKEAAQRLKLRLDKEKGGTWHVITGTHFGGNVTNDFSTMINFQVDNTWFLTFRSGPPEKAPEDGH
mmetsp:Transcript_35110/g.41011  ORF Transcript_35110/g.41011 Transcript_35110/m.41011 type:complete len:120 (+) Transcript_35110:43-402(+)